MIAFGPRSTRRLVAVGGGLLGVVALAGCAPAAGSGAASGSDASTSAAAPTSAAPASAAPASSAAPSTAAAAPASGLKDGRYTASGTYQYSGGSGKVGVTVTLADGRITAVEVVPEAADPTARQYEAQFASGIGGVAVGKPIKGLQVGAVSGSSLTSQGFEKALATIRAKAQV